MARKKKSIEVETLTHDESKRRNIPTAELQSVMRDEEKSPFRLAYERRNRDLDTQLVWRRKDEQDWSDLVVHAPPLYIQEKLHPKVLIDDLLRQSRERADREPPDMPDLFADFEGLPRRGRQGEGERHARLLGAGAEQSRQARAPGVCRIHASVRDRDGVRQADRRPSRRVGGVIAAAGGRT